MAFPRKSPQHQKAHSPEIPIQFPLGITNKTDVASFIKGVAANTPTDNQYYHCGFESDQHVLFYQILEATRCVNQAVLTYRGRKTEIKKARFSSGVLQDIYVAGVMSGGNFQENLRRAIHKACNQPAYNEELFRKAWGLYEKQVPLKKQLRYIAEDATVTDQGIHSTTLTMPVGVHKRHGGDGLPESKPSLGLLAAMRATRLCYIKPGETIVKELIHHSLLDIETGMVMRDRQILRAGMVVTSLAARLYRGRTDIFQRQTESYTGPLMAFIMDMSGSMCATWPRALAVMGAVAHTLNRAGAATICIGFAAQDYNFLYQFQDMNETFDIDRFHIFDPPSGNADAVAVEYCRRQLLSMEQEAREPKKKYIIVFSDEQPCGMFYLHNRTERRQEGNDSKVLDEALNLCGQSSIMTISALVGEEPRGWSLPYDARICTSDPETTLNRILDKMGVL